MIKALLILLVIFAAVYAFVYISAFIKNRNNLSKHSWWKFILIGLVTDIGDTLGIGNFAPTASIFKLFKLVDDRVIPGTMNAAHCLAVVTEALIFITVIKVEPVTLVTMVAASIAGAVLGAGVVAKLDVRKVRIGMGTALIVLAFILLAGLLNLMPSGGDAIGLYGGKLIFAIIVNFFLGALMTIGIGQYAPCMALVYALGMSAQVAFPIMMASCAFLMPAASIRFVRGNAVDLKAAVGITIGGIVGVLIAAYIIISIPLTVLKWVVFAVLVYTAIMLLRDGLKKQVIANHEIAQ
jgi:uncharacterized membrane protein YfcA